MKPFNYRHIAGVAVIAAAALLSGCAAMTPVRQHPDFASAALKVQSIAILPPDVEQVRIVFNGDNERLTERERAIAEELYQSFETTLKGKQYTIRPPLASVQETTKQNVDFELQQVRTAYGEASKQLYEKPASEEESKKYRVTLGPVVNPVAGLMQADALLYVRYYGFEKSGGQQAKEIVAGALFAVLTGTAVVRPAEGAALEVALIDGATGDVLWANRGNNAGPGGLGFGAATMAQNIVTPLPGKETAVARTEGSTAKPAGPTAPAPTR